MIAAPDVAPDGTAEMTFAATAGNSTGVDLSIALAEAGSTGYTGLPGTALATVIAAAQPNNSAAPVVWEPGMIWRSGMQITEASKYTINTKNWTSVEAVWREWTVGVNGSTPVEVLEGCARGMLPQVTAMHKSCFNAAPFISPNPFGGNEERA